MNLSEIKALSEMLDPEGTEDSYDLVSNPNQGSIFTPADVGDGKKQKEIAKPFAKIEVKVGNKEQLQQEPIVVPPPQQQQQQKKPKDKNDIWDQDEVQSYAKQQNETRKTPEVDVMYKQQVGTEDVFGGWSGVNPGSNSCQFLLVKISLPRCKLPEISLEVQKQVIVAQSTKYYLNYVLPYPVNEKEGKAKWISDKEILELTLPIIREELF